MSNLTNFKKDEPDRTFEIGNYQFEWMWSVDLECSRIHFLLPYT